MQSDTHQSTSHEDNARGQPIPMDMNDTAIMNMNAVTASSLLSPTTMDDEADHEDTEEWGDTRFLDTESLSDNSAESIHPTALDHDDVVGQTASFESTNQGTRAIAPASSSSPQFVIYTADVIQPSLSPMQTSPGEHYINKENSDPRPCTERVMSDARVRVITASIARTLRHSQANNNHKAAGVPARKALGDVTTKYRKDGTSKKGESTSLATGASDFAALYDAEYAAQLHSKKKLALRSIR